MRYPIETTGKAKDEFGNDQVLVIPRVLLAAFVWQKYFSTIPGLREGESSHACVCGQESCDQYQISMTDCAVTGLFLV